MKMRYRTKARARLSRLHNAQRLKANALCFQRFIIGIAARKWFPRSMARKLKPNLQSIKKDDVIGKEVVRSPVFHLQANYTLNPEDLEDHYPYLTVEKFR